MNLHVKNNIVKQLQQVSPDSIWGFAVSIAVSTPISDGLLIELLDNLQSQIADNREQMKLILGPAFDIVDTTRINGIADLNHIQMWVN